MAAISASFSASVKFSLGFGKLPDNDCRESEMGSFDKRSAPEVRKLWSFDNLQLALCSVSFLIVKGFALFPFGHIELTVRLYV